MSRLQNLIERVNAENKRQREAFGSGWGDHKPGGRITNISDMEKGDYVLMTSPDQNADNIAQIVDIDDDKATFLFKDPKDLNKKRMYSDKPFVVWGGAALKQDKIYHMAK